MNDPAVRHAAKTLCAVRRCSISEALFAIEIRAFVLAVPVTDIAAFIEVRGALPGAV